MGRIVHKIVARVKEDGSVEHRWTNVAQELDTHIDGSSSELGLLTTRSYVTMISSCEASGDGNYSPREDLYCAMRERLNSLGWEKYIVHFDSALASNHNKLAAVRRHPEWFFNGVLGFHAGDPIMEHAADYLLGVEGDSD